MTPAVTTPAGGGLIDRAIRAARLDATVYEEVEHDEAATMQAAIIVVAGAIASGVGALAVGNIAGLIAGVISGLLGWLAYAGAAYLVGTKLLAGPETKSTFMELARTLGFAAVPQIALVLAIIPVLGAILALAVLVWLLITTIFAVRAALDVTTGRAIAIAIVAALALALVNYIVATLFVRPVV